MNQPSLPVLSMVKQLESDCPLKKNVIIRLNIWIVVPFCLWAFSGCAWLIKPPSDDPMARQMLEGLLATNSAMTQYKGLAQVRLAVDKKVHTGTMAVAAVLPDRMRVELLSMVGQPLSSMVANGQTIRIRSHDDNRIYEINQSPSALETVIHIPIGIEQLQRLLIGRPKLPEFAAAQFTRKTEKEVAIEMISRFHNTQAVIVMTADTATIRSLEMHREGGEFRYLVRFLQWQQMGDYCIPKQLAIESGTGDQVTMTMRRFWPDADISADTFELATSQ